MKRRRALTASIFTAIALIALGAGAAVVLASKDRPRARRAARATAPATARTVAVTCRSPALDGTLPAEVYLPAGYTTAGARYPVVYFLHGLPASPTSYTENAFVATALAAAHRPAIVVAPQGARDVDSDRE
ncbi:MAG TPA: alpha/beta hydrolase-fold protein, partial [Solirubrobacteraceae bacterium]